MKLRVKLYGTLSYRFPDYQHLQGIEVAIPDGATVKDLLELLEISEYQGAVIITQGRVLKEHDKIQSDFTVNILQAISGG